MTSLIPGAAPKGRAILCLQNIQDWPKSKDKIIPYVKASLMRIKTQRDRVAGLAGMNLLKLNLVPPA